MNVFNALPANGTVRAQDLTVFLDQSIGGGAVTAFDISGSPVNLEVFDGWKKAMIELLAPSVYPNLVLEDALLELCTRIEDKKNYADILLRAQLGIQTWLGIRDCYDRFAEKVFEND